MNVQCNTKNYFYIISKDSRFCVAMTELSNTVDRAQAYPQLEGNKIV